MISNCLEGTPGTRRRVVALALAALGAVSLIGFGVAQPAEAAGTREGDALVVENPESDRALKGGGSETLFSLKLPDGASCPKDSQNNNYRIQGFMVPAKIDPASLKYKSIMPDAEGGFGLYDEFTNSYAQILTAEEEKPDGPGEIVNLPRFTLAVFSPGMVAPGKYRVGIACTYYNDTVRYWDNELLVEHDSGDKPAEIRWSVVGVNRGHTPNDSRSATYLLVLAAGSFALGVGFLAHKVRSRRAPSPDPHSGKQS